MLSFGYLTAPSKKEAKEIALALLDEGMIACANLFPGVESYFVWEGELTQAQECVLVFKAPAENEKKIVRLVRELHSYQSPCIVFLPIEGGDPDFLEWVGRAGR